jgi:23S rRNA (cytosine1962-C5)-methyltransferase
MIYKLLDCGNKKKVEQYGPYKLVRPCPQALWDIQYPQYWNDIDAEFTRTRSEKGDWNQFKKLPTTWNMEGKADLIWKIEPNDFGNVGVFTEHWMYSTMLTEFFDKQGKVLNLFSYTGSSCLELVRAGFKVTVLDSSKNAMTDYATNLDLNQLSRDGQRLILEDAYKFIAREIRRGSKYSSIMVDAPSFGRGTKGEVFNIEDDLVKIIANCKEILEPDGKMIVTLHSPRFTLAILEILIGTMFKGKKVEAQEILNPCESGMKLPSGFLVKIY